VAASFSQAGVLSVSTVARELGTPRKTVEGYFQLLDDLLHSMRLPVFTRRAKRPMTAHPKFYFFDDLGYQLFYWRTRDQHEVDFVLYGERGLWAFEVKRTSRFQERDLASLKLFAADYPVAHCVLLYGGDKAYEVDGIRVMPLATALPVLHQLLRA
jgi:predicted AAA+ superfamily ATPase